MEPLGCQPAAAAGAVLRLPEATRPGLDPTLLSAPEADCYLDPRTAKLGGRQTYGRLPNAAEIDAALSADETGWLFPLVP